jgi:hypothetical protein
LAARLSALTHIGHNGQSSLVIHRWKMAVNEEKEVQKGDRVRVVEGNYQGGTLGTVVKKRHCFGTVSCFYASSSINISSFISL